MTDTEYSTPTPPLERGAASIIVSLDKGVITVLHGDAPTAVLFQAPVQLGTWDAMWEVIRMGEVK